MKINIKFSCVMDKAPVFQKQVFIWLNSLTRIGKIPVSNIIIHILPGVDATFIKYLKTTNVTIRFIEPFDSRCVYYNKLRQFESSFLEDADYVVLMDCDTAFCETFTFAPKPNVDIYAKVVDGANPSFSLLKEIFSKADIAHPETIEVTFPSATNQDKQITFKSNCNGGVLIISKAFFSQLKTAWKHWALWLIERPNLMGGYNFFGQVSFSLAVSSLKGMIDHLPITMNFPLNLKNTYPATYNITPSIVHYHKNIDDNGLIQKIGLNHVDHSIDLINDMIKQISFPKTKNIFKKIKNILYSQ